ncbi:MAG: hypothetical protein WBY53_00300 [Acidobacteriaceae bacterium]
MSICALTCCVAFNLPCLAQANPWNGSWKVDPGATKYDGPVFSIKTDADGFTVTRYGKASPKEVCDGKPHPGMDGDMTTCEKDGSGYRIEDTKDGKPTVKVMLTMTDDGKMSKRVIEIYPVDGPSYQVVTGAKRISGGTGWDGTWKTVMFNEPQDTGILSIDVHGDMIAFKETDNDKPLECKLDGTPTKFGDRTVSIHQVGTHTLKVEYRGSNGKLQRSNTFVLSADGKTVHETDVTPAPSPSTMSETLHKT